MKPRAVFAHLKDHSDKSLDRKSLAVNYAFAASGVVRLINVSPRLRIRDSQGLRNYETNGAHHRVLFGPRRSRKSTITSNIR